ARHERDHRPREEHPEERQGHRRRETPQRPAPETSPRRGACLRRQSTTVAVHALIHSSRCAETSSGATSNGSSASGANSAQPSGSATESSAGYMYICPGTSEIGRASCRGKLEHWVVG